MSKEWILNATTGRYQLNFKRNVGAVAEEIRKCEPKTLEEWQEYYFRHVYPPEHLEELGRKLYVKVTEVIQAEVNAITEQDCIDYIRNFVISRTFEGYLTEKTTVYERLFVARQPLVTASTAATSCTR
jgi:MjaI restriction endonuclease